MTLKTVSGFPAAASVRPGESVASAKAADGAISRATDAASRKSFTREPRAGAFLVLEVRPQSSCTVNLSLRASARGPQFRLARPTVGAAFYSGNHPIGARAYTVRGRVPASGKGPGEARWRPRGSASVRSVARRP